MLRMCHLVISAEGSQHNYFMRVTFLRNDRRFLSPQQLKTSKRGRISGAKIGL